MGQRGKGEGQRTIGRSEKRDHGWGGLRFFCLSMGEIFSKEEQKEEHIKKKRERKKSEEERKKKKE